MLGHVGSGNPVDPSSFGEGDGTEDEQEQVFNNPFKKEKGLDALLLDIKKFERKMTNGRAPLTTITRDDVKSMEERIAREEAAERRREELADKI